MKKTFAVAGIVVGSIAALAVGSFIALIMIVTMVYPHGYIPAVCIYVGLAAVCELLRGKYRKSFGIKAPAFYALAFAPSAVLGALAMAADRLMYFNGIIKEHALYEAVWFVALALVVVLLITLVLSLIALICRVTLVKIAKSANN